MQQCCVWRPKHLPSGFICGHHASCVDDLCAMHCAMHHCCGRLGGAVAVGMGNTLGPGETGRRCMVISLGVSTRGLTGVQCGKRRGPQRGVCHLQQQNLEGFFCSPVAWPLPASLSTVRLAIACFFIFLQSVWPQPASSSRFCCDIALQPSPLPHCTPVRPRVEA